MKARNEQRNERSARIDKCDRDRAKNMHRLEAICDAR